MTDRFARLDDDALSGALRDLTGRHRLADRDHRARKRTRYRDPGARPTAGRSGRTAARGLAARSTRRRPRPGGPADPRRRGRSGRTRASRSAHLPGQRAGQSATHPRPERTDPVRAARLDPQARQADRPGRSRRRGRAPHRAAHRSAARPARRGVRRPAQGPSGRPGLGGATRPAGNARSRRRTRVDVVRRAGRGRVLRQVRRQRCDARPG